MSKICPEEDMVEDCKTKICYTLEECNLRDPTYKWYLRNNSLNMAGILNTDYFIPSNVKKRGSKQRGTTHHADVVRKPSFGTNDCYCRKKKIKPKLFSKPKSCVFTDPKDDEDLIRKSLLSKQETLQGSPCRCVIERSKSVNKYEKDEPSDDNTSIKFTRERKDYERYREKQEYDFLKKVDNYDEQQKQVSNSAPDTSENNSRKLSMLQETEDRLEILEHDRQSENAEDLKEFRKDHYLETHSTEDLVTNAADHVCIHQFKLDDRFGAAPLNTDVLGRSRCEICGKSMDGNESLAGTNHDRNLKMLMRAQQYGLAQKPVNIGSSKSNIVLNLSDQEICKIDKCIVKMKKLQYTNTLALRQQKMTI